MRKLEATFGIAATALLLSACVDQSAVKSQQQSEERQAQLDASLNNWNGQDVSNLIAKAGAPASVFRMPSGMDLYTWDNSIPTPDLVGGTMVLVCSIRFVVNPTSHLIITHSRTGC